jgi:hypothetical protein
MPFTALAYAACLNRASLAEAEHPDGRTAVTITILAGGLACAGRAVDPRRGAPHFRSVALAVSALRVPTKL